MPRVGLSPESVVATAATMLDTDPGEDLTLSRLASVLGVRAPSLYNHVAGLEDVLRRVALAGIAELGDELRTAAMGRTGAEAVAAIAAAYRAFARRRPGVYPLTQLARPDDAEYAALSERAIEPVEAVLSGRTSGREELIHQIRFTRSALHGFVLLENQRGFGLDVDVDDSFDHLVASLAATVAPGDG